MRGARAAHDYSGNLTSSSSAVVQLLADANELLDVQCWCESTTVLVPQREVVDCTTRSCGALRCRGPLGEHEQTATRGVGRRAYSWTRSLAPRLHDRDGRQS